MSTQVAIVHDYLSQTGGAERVVLSMLRAFPDAPVYTSVYDPDRTFPEFRDVDVRPIGWLNAIGPLRRNHRVGLPLYGPAFRRLEVTADVVLCSSSGWAHHVNAHGRKIVYCYTPARWLYQKSVYLRGRPVFYGAALSALSGPLRAHDQAAASTADCYLTSSTEVRRRIEELYRVDAEVIAPPPALAVSGPVSAVGGVDPGYLLVVSRLLPYKNVDVVMAAAEQTGRRLVIVGDGPDRRRLTRAAGSNVTMVGTVDDSELRWLYRNCQAVIALSHEDFGLVPVEANAFGVPVVVLRWGGFLDTVVDGQTGVFCETPDVTALASALERFDSVSWDRAKLHAHAAGFSEERFVRRLRESIGASVLGESSLAEFGEVAP